MKSALFSLLCFITLGGFCQTGTFTVSSSVTPAGCSKGEIKLVVTAANEPYTATWSNGYTGLNPEELDTGLYIVTLTDTLLNDTSISFYVEAKECPISIPGFFTPNGDGVNDKWAISGTENYTAYLVHVYNRYGIKVFDGSNNFEPWDGKSSGLNVPDATYYYVIEYTDPYFGEQTKAGSITIIR
jgi:gliding motility-associated-like protein